MSGKGLLATSGRHVGSSVELIILLKHGHDRNDGNDGKHGCTVVMVAASTYVLCPRQQNWVTVNLGRQK